MVFLLRLEWEVGSFVRCTNVAVHNIEIEYVLSTKNLHNSEKINERSGRGTW
jgi:hypothetical protein